MVYHIHVCPVEGMLTGLLYSSPDLPACCCEWCAIEVGDPVVHCGVPHTCLSSRMHVQCTLAYSIQSVSGVLQRLMTQ